jgi:hypothetical protein
VRRASAADPGVVGDEALERARPGEGAAGPPPHGRAARGGGEIDDLEAEVREGREKLREVLADAVRSDELLGAHEPVDAAGPPARDGRVEIVIGQSGEVAPGGVRRGGHEAAAVYASPIWCAP